MNDKGRYREYDTAKQISINNQYDPRMLDGVTDNIKRKSPDKCIKKDKMKHRKLIYKTCRGINEQISPI
jgi:hypothetical protein